jgi:hypothetical protein
MPTPQRKNSSGAAGMLVIAVLLLMSGAALAIFVCKHHPKGKEIHRQLFESEKHAPKSKMGR